MGLISNIKDEARGKGVNIQSSEEAELEKKLNKLFYLDKNVEEETEFVNMLMLKNGDDQKRVGLHASAMISAGKEYCLRQQVLSLLYEQNQSEQVSIPLKRIFEEGDSIHQKWQRLLIRGGYSKATDLDMTRFDDEWNISYTPDAICRIEDFFDGKMVVEIKSVNAIQYTKMPHHPSAGKQLQWYMHLLIKDAKKRKKWNGVDYTRGFVLNENKNTQDFKLEFYEYDESLSLDYIERAEEIKERLDIVKEKKKMVKRPKFAKNVNVKKCKECNMRDACWNVGMGRVKL